MNRGKLDVCETYIRDILYLKVENWVKFRRAILRGIYPDTYLKAKDGSEVPEPVKDSYRDLGKCNYQVVMNLGYAYDELCSASDQERELIRLCRLWHDHEEDWRAKLEYGQANLRFNMTISSFYNHLVSVLDGISHLIFIIFHPNSAKEPYKSARKKVLLRKRINWGILTVGKCHEFCKASGFKYLMEDKPLKKIVRIRNHLTHAWEIPHSIPPSGEGAGRWCWPEEAKCRGWLPWPGDPEVNKLHFTLVVVPQAEKYFRHIEKLLDERVFPHLTRGIPKWEENNGVEIKEPISKKTPQEKCEHILEPPTSPPASAGISDIYLQRDGQSA